MKVNYLTWLGEFFKIFSLRNTDYDYTSIKPTDISCLSFQGLSEERRNRLWLKESSYFINWGTKTLSLSINTDFNKDIMYICLMTDQFYQSKTGEALHDFYIWCDPAYKDKIEIDLKDNHRYKQNINSLYYVSHIEDMISIACAIGEDRNIPNVPMELSVEMATRIVIRRCWNILKKAPKISHAVPELCTNHLIEMCEVLLCKSYPLDKMNRWLGYIQAGLVVHNLITVNDERDFTRPIFHKAYKSENIDIP